MLGSHCGYIVISAQVVMYLQDEIFHTIAKPIMATEYVTITLEQRSNTTTVLTCCVQYANPPPTIEWYSFTALSNGYTLIQENSSDYKLHNNGNVEIFHESLFDIGYLTIMCSATNTYGSGQSKFQMWGYETFLKSKFKYVCHNVTMTSYSDQLVSNIISL